VILYKTVNVYYLIILMRYFEEIPSSLVEAAQVDGREQYGGADRT
jgi:putative aldouronate transport system permease protein